MMAGRRLCGLPRRLELERDGLAWQLDLAEAIDFTIWRGRFTLSALRASSIAWSSRCRSAHSRCDAKPLGLSAPSAGAVSCDRKMKDRQLIWLKNFIKPRSVCHPPIEWRGRPVIGKAKLLFCPLQHDHHSKSNFPSDRFRYLLFQSQHRTNQCSWHERPALKSPAHRIRK
jgi:hypothetical protein